MAPGDLDRWADRMRSASRQSVKGHHLPIFQGLRFCMSGFELGAQRRPGLPVTVLVS